MIRHLTIRVPWHDNRWNGTVCRAPSQNTYCLALNQMRKERNDAAEDAVAGKPFWELELDQLPSCSNLSGAFMNEMSWRRQIRHPYHRHALTHGHLVPTLFTLPPYSTFAVPFWWMLLENQDEIEQTFPSPLPPDEDPPFNSSWVFGLERQKALLNHFFGQVTEKRSLIFFYTKEGHPLGDEMPRLIAGVGTIQRISKMLMFETDNSGKPSYPAWERILEHSIKPDGDEGFLMPYHEYLESTGDLEEDARRQELVHEIGTTVDQAHIFDFSYVSELATPDVVVSSLSSLLAVVRKIRHHGIAKGPWEKREDWLNNQIAQAWADRGAFPGTGAALEAIGMRLGTSLIMELSQNNILKADQNPWDYLDAVLRGNTEAPAHYRADLEAVRKTWDGLTQDRRDLLQLLSRFELSQSQALRWFDPNKRNKATRSEVTDKQILANPYLIAENDLGDEGDFPVVMPTLDRGLLPDSTISSKFPVPSPSKIESQNDARRIRASIVGILRHAADDGDTLLSEVEVLERLDELPLTRSIQITSDWLSSNRAELSKQVAALDLLVKAEENERIAALQLVELQDQESNLQRLFIARSKRELPRLEVKWRELLKVAIERNGFEIDESNPRHTAALREQAEALAKITSRKMSALVGSAGTGKTSVLGALLECDELRKDGILLLAPTGKARVRLARLTRGNALTVAQFLYQCQRYDGVRQRPLFHGKEKYQKEKNVIIDEASMLTMDDLFAVTQALDLGHVERIILVGDPNQLPPIGAGRPFADYVGYLELQGSSENDEDKQLGNALARLSEELRTARGAPSKALKLASWFTREPQPVDADRVLGELTEEAELNDLEICFWTTQEELHQKLIEQMHKHLGIKDENDYVGLSRALGADESGKFQYAMPSGAANFQILSPVRMNTHGVYELNHWMQRQFRGGLLKRAKHSYGLLLGPEEIIFGDKVIQLVNQRKFGYDWKSKTQIKELLANGELGIMAGHNKNFGNVVFEGREGLTFGYKAGDFSEKTTPLELAYAITIHKAQGSEFQKVFVVIPRQTRLLSRELLYTALTRAREELVLLIEGDDASFIHEYARPESSNTATRNTNLFNSSVRETRTSVPYAEHLIHRTLGGELVRSKSELVIANILFERKVEYRYERKLEVSVDGNRQHFHPDFTFVDMAGDVIVWEHLGMMSRENYREAWDWKKSIYLENGYEEGRNIFTTRDDENGGLDAQVVNALAEKLAQSL